MQIEEAARLVRERYTVDKKRIEDERVVLETFGSMFRPLNLEKLIAEDFRSFLVPKNNKHRTSIHRQGSMLTADMDKLRNTLRLLLDETRPIRERLGKILPKNKPPAIKGLGRAVITPILLIAYPDKYAVYDSATERGMQRFHIFPNFKNESFAEKYVKINGIINTIAREQSLSLWQIDEMWWKPFPNPTPSLIEPASEKIVSDDTSKLDPGIATDLESQLEELLISNWERIPEFAELEILKDDEEYTGQQYRTDSAGIIDLLCKDKSTGDFVIIELKKNRGSDHVVGQALQYIGWVRKNLVTKGEGVRGIIIANEDDQKLRYALEPVRNLIQLKFYKLAISISSA